MVPIDLLDTGLPQTLNLQKKKKKKKSLLEFEPNPITSIIILGQGLHLWDELFACNLPFLLLAT